MTMCVKFTSAAGCKIVMRTPVPSPILQENYFPILQENGDLLLKEQE